MAYTCQVKIELSSGTITLTGADLYDCDNEMSQIASTSGPQFGVIESTGKIEIDNSTQIWTQRREQGVLVSDRKVTIQRVSPQGSAADILWRWTDSWEFNDDETRVTLTLKGQLKKLSNQLIPEMQPREISRAYELVSYVFDNCQYSFRWNGDVPEPLITLSLGEVAREATDGRTFLDEVCQALGLVVWDDALDVIGYRLPYLSNDEVSGSGKVNLTFDSSIYTRLNITQDLENRVQGVSGILHSGKMVERSGIFTWQKTYGDPADRDLKYSLTGDDRNNSGYFCRDEDWWDSDRLTFDISGVTRNLTHHEEIHVTSMQVPINQAGGFPYSWSNLYTAPNNSMDYFNLPLSYASPEQPTIKLNWNDSQVEKSSYIELEQTYYNWYYFTNNPTGIYQLSPMGPEVPSFIVTLNQKRLTISWTLRTDQRRYWWKENDHATAYRWKIDSINVSVDGEIWEESTTTQVYPTDSDYMFKIPDTPFLTKDAKRGNKSLLQIRYEELRDTGFDSGLIVTEFEYKPDSSDMANLHLGEYIQIKNKEGEWVGGSSSKFRVVKLRWRFHPTLTYTVTAIQIKNV